MVTAAAGCNSTTVSPERNYKLNARHNRHEKIKISVSYPSSENLRSPTQGANHANIVFPDHYSSLANERESGSTVDSSSSSNAKYRMGKTDSLLQVVKSMPDMDKDCGSTQKYSSPHTSRKMGKRNIKAQVKRFRMETKAAKTLAIIVGLFIVCWLPFFTVYVIRAFCSNCINSTVFSVIFWLGYCNSAVNPMIYALFSKDFRFAFKLIICRCFCGGANRRTPSMSRRGSDMSHVKVRTPSISPSAAAQSICEDSDPIMELSDSR